jgi:hypothetical protein
MSEQHDRDDAHPAAPSRHPAPHRHRVGAWAMWFSILGAPIAWSAQQLVNPPIFAHGCFPNDAPLTESIWRNGGTVAFSIEAAAIVVCLVAGAVAWRNWRRTRDEKEGSGHHLIESGDGRSRFMAMVGVLCSGGFLLAVLVSTALLALVPACNG